MVILIFGLSLEISVKLDGYKMLIWNSQNTALETEDTRSWLQGFSLFLLHGAQTTNPWCCLY